MTGPYILAFLEIFPFPPVILRYQIRVPRKKRRQSFARPEPSYT